MGAVILAAVIGLAVLDATHISLTALGGAVLMLTTEFLKPGGARRAMNWTVLIVIGAALGIANAMEISVAASMSFATPLGYQTSLMVYGPGGYQFKDFMKVGIPLPIIAGLLAVLLIPLFWRF